MPNPETIDFYRAYVTNVRDFLLVESEIRRTLNRALKTNKDLSIKAYTKMYALLYSTYSEASFMKTILTPYGFEQAFVEEILRQDNIQKKWLKCLELAFLKYTESKKASEIPNKKLELGRIIQKFIVEPSELRNKIAHGQLTVAMNRANTNLNPSATTKLGDLNFIAIQRLFEINKRLCSIIEDLIESPQDAHYRFYYPKYQELEDYISRSDSWTMESKKLTKSMQKVVPKRVTS